MAHDGDVSDESTDRPVDDAEAVPGTPPEAQRGAESPPPAALPETEPAAETPAPPAPRMTMADYEEAMSARGQAARARGLAAPYIAGGRDPDPAAGRREERYYMRLLVLMVAVIVLGGFAIAIVGLLVSGGG